MCVGLGGFTLPVFRYAACRKRNDVVRARDRMMIRRRLVMTFHGHLLFASRNAPRAHGRSRPLQRPRHASFIDGDCAYVAAPKRRTTRRFLLFIFENPGPGGARRNPGLIARDEVACPAMPTLICREAKHDDRCYRSNEECQTVLRDCAESEFGPEPLPDHSSFVSATKVASALVDARMSARTSIRRSRRAMEESARR